jgi:hypothetical protein
VGHYAKERLEEPAPPEPSLLEVLRRSAANQKALDALEADLRRWSPRAKSELESIVNSQAFVPGTPEHAVVETLTAWQERKFGKIAQHSTDSLKKEGANPLAGKIRRNLGQAPSVFTITEIEDAGVSAAWITADLLWGDEKEAIRLRLLYMREGKWAPRTSLGGIWMVASLWPLESVRWQVRAESPSDE